MISKLSIQNFKNHSFGDNAISLIKTLYPICRSITGNGVRDTLSIISEIIPITINEVDTGTQVLDWKIPKEWNIHDAWIKDSRGKKIVDFKNSNLHVLNYSIPVHKNISLKELKNHLFTIPEYPSWIPYRTSYHNDEWGFCISHNQMKELKEGMYQVKIDSKHTDGSLTFGEYFIKGELDSEVLISTHICHPSLANDNLSGIALAVYLAEALSKMKTKFSYRFLFIPGTIGSITWLSLNESTVPRIKYGLVLSLLGAGSDFTFKKSREGNSEIDLIVENCLLHSSEEFKILDFSPYGYDERQFCSPGYNLPLGRLSRSDYGEFPEYHTSADNLEFIEQIKLEKSYQLIQSIIMVIEENKKYRNLYPQGEPQLGRRGLFKKVGGPSKMKEFHMALLWVLNQSDGANSLLNISQKSKLSFDIILNAALELENVGLLDEIINSGEI